MILQSSLSVGSAASFLFSARRIRTHIWKPRKRRGDNMSKFNWGMRACGVFLLWAATAVALPAQTTRNAAPAIKFTTLHTFKGTDGANPYAVLIQATDGNFYGTTSLGGANSFCAYGAGCGTVFKITPTGRLATLHSFDIADGEYIPAGLIQATNGTFYGTTFQGGANSEGTVFKITASGKLTTLYSFCSQTNCTDGEAPDAGLVQVPNGTFYGTTAGGGANYRACRIGCGTVFKITPSGTLTTLHSFDIADGAYPGATLIQATDGNLYGTTSAGGAASTCMFQELRGCGTVFKITPSGMLTVLHRFERTDGGAPVAGLVQSTDGSFYGTAAQGGANDAGTIFKITPNGTLTTLHRFDNTDGSYPAATLIQATDGNFYGTTAQGGANDAGTIFKITPNGTLTTLHTFCSQSDCADGGGPEAGLVQSTNGNFYGTTGGGDNNKTCSIGCGTVFSLSVGLGPFVETNPMSGGIGKAVKILGTNLTGATSVTFNGTAATFTVVSKSLITTTVPFGATTGTVQVVTPGGTLSSNASFRVK
jgi:uncharacterized repeat protein (TIGR03803 family)